MSFDQIAPAAGAPSMGSLQFEEAYDPAVADEFQPAPIGAEEPSADIAPGGSGTEQETYSADIAPTGSWTQHESYGVGARMPYGRSDTFADPIDGITSPAKSPAQQNKNKIY